MEQSSGNREVKNPVGPCRFLGVVLAGLSMLVVGCQKGPKPAEEIEKEAEAEATQDLLSDSKKSDELFSKVDELAKMAAQEESQAMGEMVESQPSATPAPAEATGKEKAKEEKPGPSKEILAAFGVGQKYRANWTWGGDIKGELALTILEAKGPSFKARLTLPSNPNAARDLQGSIETDVLWPVRLKSLPGSGVQRDASRNPFGRDPSLRWLFADADYEIRLKQEEGIWAGVSGKEVQWRLLR